MIARNLMKLLQKFFRNGEKLNANEVAICTDEENNKYKQLDKYLNINISDDGTPTKIGFKINGKDVYCLYKTLGKLTNKTPITFDVGITISNVTPILTQVNGSARWGNEGAGMEKPLPSGDCEVSLRNDGLLLEPQIDLSTTTASLFMLFIYKRD